MFFARGESDTKKLEEKKINIWKGNTSREFLDSVGLNHLPEGSLGRGYGVQWRDWRSSTIDCFDNKYGNSNDAERYFGAIVDVKHTDQLKNLLDGLKNDPNGRRHIISSWNVGELDQMALMPCHYLQQYYVRDGKLDSLFSMRSTDTIYGLPYNLMSYAFLNHAFAKILGLEPGNLTYFGADVHIYKNQLWMAEEMVKREERPFPQLIIHKELKTLDDFLSLEYSDVELVDYDPHPDFKDKPPMAV